MLAGGTVMVPGGAGYIGSHTVRSLVAEGYKVVVVDNLCNGNKESVDPAATFEQCDLGDLPALLDVFARHKPESVIDFAAFLAVGESQADPLSYMQTNVVNFVNVMDAMKAHGCKFIIKSSTSSTYGDPPDPDEFPLKEDYQDRYCRTIAASALGKGTANFIEGGAAQGCELRGARGPPGPLGLAII
jgi:UDP-glucose 4-epimerase